jgi:glycine hydroxymethyltransferase
MNRTHLDVADPAVATIIAQEQERQATTINLIASENYAPLAVREATASVLTNKYAEGYPGKRYYAGCQVVDRVELLAIERCKKLFGAEHVNVQPHAGSQANMAVYAAVLKPGDTILGMSLAEGGHLTHGHAVNFSGTIYKSVQYTVNRDTELLDFDEIERLAHEHKPKLIVAGASAYSRVIDFERFAAIAQSVGALFMADIAHIAGLIAAHVHPSPFPHADFVTSTTHKTLRGPRGGLIMCKAQYAQVLDRAIIPGIQGGPFMQVIAAKAVAFQLAARPEFVAYQQQVILNARVMAAAFADLGYRIVTGGTDNHLFVLDLRNKNITGLAAEKALEAAGITVSRSGIPFDVQKPWITSGIRIGTPAITTRGMQEHQVLEIVRLIDEVIKAQGTIEVCTAVQQRVIELCQEYPILG